MTMVMVGALNVMRIHIT
jgi:phosphatidylserine decarboxylase